MMTHKHKKAFTLVELLVTMGIFTALFSVLAQVFASVVEARLKSEVETQLAREQGWILARMAYDVHRAESIESVGVGSTLNLTIGGVSYSYQVIDGMLYFGPAGAIRPILDHEIEATELVVTRMQDMAGTESVQVNLTLRARTELAGNLERERMVNTTYATR